MNSEKRGPGRPPGMVEGSMVNQISNLEPGGCFSRAVVLRPYEFTPELVSRTQLGLSNTVNAAAKRARANNPDHRYRVHSAHCFTQALDIIITVAVTREA